MRGRRRERKKRKNEREQRDYVAAIDDKFDDHTEKINGGLKKEKRVMKKNDSATTKRLPSIRRAYRGPGGMRLASRLRSAHPSDLSFFIYQRFQISLLISLICLETIHL